MSSPEMSALRTDLERLKRHLIVSGKDYAQYSDRDNDLALGFRVLASAALEGAVENRCRSLAASGVERLRRRQPTRLGRTLVLENLIRQGRGAIPVKDSEFSPTPQQLDSALESYQQRVKNSHGIKADDFRRLVLPLGLQELEIPSALMDRLDTLGDSRGQAAHSRVNRRRLMVEPIHEYNVILDILADLQSVDAALERSLQYY